MEHGRPPDLAADGGRRLQRVAKSWLRGGASAQLLAYARGDDRYALHDAVRGISAKVSAFVGTMQQIIRT